MMQSFEVTRKQPGPRGPVVDVVISAENPLLHSPPGSLRSKAVNPATSDSAAAGMTVALVMWVWGSGCATPTKP